MVKITTSEFINSLFESYNGMSNFYQSCLDNKMKIDNHNCIDILVYNTVMDKNNDKINKLQTDSVYTFQTLHDKIMKDNVECYHGKTKNEYTEFLRAWCKLIYRLFNDGDSVFYGPYSALNYYLYSNQKRKFFLGEDFGYVCFDEYLIEGLNGNLYEEAFNNLIIYLSKNNNYFFPDMIDSISNLHKTHFKDTENLTGSIISWNNVMISMIDQLTDDIKGINNTEYFKDCSDYYKNMLEYKNEKLYNFFVNNYNISNWGGGSFIENNSDNFESGDEDLNIDIQYNQITIEFRPCDLGINFDMKISFNLENIGINEKLDRLFTIYDDYKRNQRITCLTIAEYIEYHTDIQKHLDKQVKIFEMIIDKNNPKNYVVKEKLFEGELKDLKDDNILNDFTIIRKTGFPNYYSKETKDIISNVIEIVKKESK